MSLSFIEVVLNRGSCLPRERQNASKGRSMPYALYNIESLRPEKVPVDLRTSQGGLRQMTVTSGRRGREKLTTTGLQLHVLPSKRELECWPYCE